MEIKMTGMGFNGFNEGLMLGTVMRQNDEIAALEKCVNEWKEYAKKLETSLAVQKALYQARTACVNALKIDNPNSKLLKKSGRIYSDGDPQTALGLIYDNKFCEEMRKAKLDPIKFKDIAK